MHDRPWLVVLEYTTDRGSVADIDLFKQVARVFRSGRK
jgi:hypothetical protein